MRNLIAIIAVTACLLLIVFWLIGLAQGKHNQKPLNPEQELKNTQEVEQLLKNSQPEKSLTIIEAYQNQLANNTDEGRKWRSYLIEASGQLKNFPQLLAIFKKYPNEFEHHEIASLVLANGLLATKNATDYQALRKEWEGRETLKDQWLLVDSDHLLLEGNREKAIESLESKSLKGKDETKRLIRLALLYAPNQPRMAWRYLTEAQKIDPNNKDILLYKGRLLEAFGKNSAAEKDFQAAAQSDPTNILLQDQLAEFYRRTNQLPKAVEIWDKMIQPKTPEFLWVKAIFWNKIVGPNRFNISKNELPDGSLKPYIEYLLELPENEFWNVKSFQALQNSSKFLETQQSAFWLRLLDSLKSGNEDGAWNLLQYNLFDSVSWSPTLTEALKQILTYRKVKHFSIEKPTESNVVDSELPTFFKELNRVSKQSDQELENDESSKKFIQLILSKDVFAEAFAAAGWSNAAVELRTKSTTSLNYPTWFSHDLTRAILQAKGSNSAIEYAKQEPKTPQLSLFLAEIFLTQNQPKEALDELLPLVNEAGEIGFKSSKWVALLYFQNSQFTKAKEIIRNNPKLQNDPFGEKILARIALEEGDSDLAETIYTSIQEASPEAKSYLAKQAYNKRDWIKAKQLTEELLRENPNSSLFKENLQVIMEELD